MLGFIPSLLWEFIFEYMVKAEFNSNFKAYKFQTWKNEGLSSQNALIALSQIPEVLKI